uniref:alkaline phosphatase n=1 Tax=Anopheles farauti TaxID=69004 RepID=A0A182QX35_9DIPT
MACTHDHKECVIVSCKEMAREEFSFATNDTATGTYSRHWQSGSDVNGRENVGNNFSRRKVSCGCNALCIGTVVLVIFGVVLLCIGFIVAYENEGQVIAIVDLVSVELPPEQAVWFEKNLAELRNAFRVMEENKRRAKNVVLFVALDSAEIPAGEARPIWESFPHLALLRPTREHTRTSFNPTSMFCGIEVYEHSVGFDSTVKPSDDCVGPVNITHRAASIVQWAQAVGRRTGVLTNGEIVHPFPAALYAHTPNASWHYTSPDDQRCPDVRSQLLQSETAARLNVIAGTMNCPEEFCRESFGVEWKRAKTEDGFRYKLWKDVSDMLDSDDDYEHALGIYDQQSLAAPGAFFDLTVGALNGLISPEGFLLVAIADPNIPIGMSEIDAAVRITLHKLSRVLDDSLIVVIRSEARERGSSFATVHATGPMSHLLHRVHNQTFLAHFISYAARIGRFRDADLTNLILQIL